MARANPALPIVLAALLLPRILLAQEASPAPKESAPTEASHARESHAVTPSEVVLEAREALEDQRYDDALAEVKPLLKAAPRWRVAALEITAVAHLILGRAADAKVALEDLYELAPAFALRDPSLPPRVTSAFDAEAALPHKRSVLVQLRPDLADRQGFDLVAGGSTTSVHLACRRDALDPFVPFPTTRHGELHHFRVPTGHTYQCYVVALDGDDLPLGRLGHETAPFNAVPRAGGPPVYTRWYFWANIVGAAVTVGVTTGIVVQALATPPRAPNADLTVHFEPTIFRW